MNDFVKQQFQHTAVLASAPFTTDLCLIVRCGLHQRECDCFGFDIECNIGRLF